MTTHREKRIIPHLPENLYALVADVAAYPQFLPWCMAARIHEKSEAHLKAELIIGFKLYRERFTSLVTLDRDALVIQTEYVDGPFKYLHNEWRFAPDEAGCAIDFHVDFEFRSALFQSMIETFFTEATRRMARAFETRADELYPRVGARVEKN